MNFQQPLPGFRAAYSVYDQSRTVLLKNHHSVSRTRPINSVRHLSSVISTRELTDGQWAALEPLFAPPLGRPDRRGRPWTDTRAVLKGVLFILRTGAPWRDWPDCYPSRSTCHRRFQQWVRQGLFQHLLEDLASTLLDGGLLDLSECYIDGTFAPAKRGGLHVGKTKRGKGSKLIAVADKKGLPLAVTVRSATPHEVTLVQPTLDTRFVEELPTRLIGDKAYDSDQLDADLNQTTKLWDSHAAFRRNWRRADFTADSW